MAEFSEAAMKQMESILRVVVKAPVFNGKAWAWKDRSLQVTSSIADLKISPRIAKVNPEWAKELGPLEAAERLLAACAHYETREAKERAEKEAKLLADLRAAIEACRAAAREDLIFEALELQRPVPRSRSLVRPQPRVVLPRVFITPPPKGVST